MSNKPKLVPMNQVEAAVRLASHNSAAFSVQIVEEQMLLMLHEQFGFGRERCMKALRALAVRMADWEKDVMSEFDAETFRMGYKAKQNHRTELAWTIEKHDAALEPLIDPEVWKPWKERYRSFGGTGVWCE